MMATNNFELIQLQPTRRFQVYGTISLYQAAYHAFAMTDPIDKAEITKFYSQKWKNHEVHQVYFEDDLKKEPLSQPGRPESQFKGYNIRSDSIIPEEMRPKIKNNMKKSGIEFTIHGIANAELYAIDLFWDIIVRYINFTKDFPREFFDDIIFIVEQEAFHFLAWNSRLDAFGFPFGYFPFQDGLWQSAIETADNILSRLTVINLTHEAKGLDSYLKTKEKLESVQDEKSASIIEVNYREEIGHVRIGVKWFEYICALDHRDPIEVFHQLSNKHFKGKLKEPFNHEARAQAGMTRDWYMPIAASE